MITGEYAVLRMADLDDAPVMWRHYYLAEPRSAFLDRRRELAAPTVDEVRESVAQSLQQPLGETVGFVAIEDKQGDVRGFCALRPAPADTGFAEIVLSFEDVSDFAGPMGDETLEYLIRNAFAERRLGKLMAHCFDTEKEYRSLLLRHGFQSEGTQREVHRARGGWLDLEAFSLFREMAAQAGTT